LIIIEVNTALSIIVINDWKCVFLFHILLLL